MNERILEIISSLGIKKVEFAKRLNLSAPYISELCAGKTTPSDRTISDICREFDVNVHWLRTGEGEMFIKKSRDEEVAAFVGDILSGDPDFRLRLISVLARLKPESWQLLEAMAMELWDEMKEADP